MVKLVFIGHLGKDCVVNNVNGKTVINFSAAHTEKWKDNQGADQSKTTWVEFAHWTDKTAVAQYLLKGTQVYVEAVPEVKTFQKGDGSTGASMAARVIIVQLLGSASGNAGNQQQQQSPPPGAPPQPVWNGTQWVTPAPGQQQQPGFQAMDKLPF